MCVDYLPYSDTEFPVTKATREGVKQIQSMNPYQEHSAAEMFTCADVWYEQKENGKTVVVAQTAGAWVFVKGVDFGQRAKKISVTAGGKGRIELRLDERESMPVLTVEADGECKASSVDISELKLTGVHDLYFVFSETDVCLATWQFA